MYLKTSVAIVNRDDHVRKKMRIKNKSDDVLSRPGPSREEVKHQRKRLKRELLVYENLSESRIKREEESDSEDD